MIFDRGSGAVHVGLLKLYLSGFLSSPKGSQIPLPPHQLTLTSHLGPQVGGGAPGIDDVTATGRPILPENTHLAPRDLYFGCTYIIMYVLCKRRAINLT